MVTCRQEVHELVSTARRTRITVDVSPDLQRRIKQAALSADVSIRRFVESLLEEAVSELGEEAPETSGILSVESVARMDRIRESSRHWPGAGTTDAAEDIRRMRDERSLEIAE